MTIPATLKRLLAHETSLRDVMTSLATAARRYHAPTIGAMQLCCADESERETQEAFQTEFAQRLLPELKFWSRSPFQLRTLGARYDPGALAIGESHFATEESQRAFKVFLVKINSHVSVIEDVDGQLIFGRMERYDQDSCYCGAIDALLSGDGDLPFVAELARTFHADGLDRLSMLRDPDLVVPQQRALLGAVCNSVLQSRRVMAEILARVPASPTLYLICAGVTLNRMRDDTELVTMLATVDQRGEELHLDRVSVGSDPRQLRVETAAGRLRLIDGRSTSGSSA